MEHNNVIVIAEAGVNHNGSIDLAKELIIKASEAKADFIKFQTFIPSNIVVESAELAEYQKKNTKFKNQSEMLESLTLPFDAYYELIQLCKKMSIGFLTTPFDIPSVNFVSKLDLPFIKIGSGEILNVPLLRAIAKLNKPIVLSTGLSTMEDISFALNLLNEEGVSNDKISLMHCTTEYPCPYDQVNLKVIKTLKKAFPKIYKVGYSDHTEGIEVSLAAIAMGASIIEKHFTLDKNMKGPDHKASLDPKELGLLVKSIRNIENSLGDGVKAPTINEQINLSVVRKSIVAKQYIKKGDLITEDIITVKRPGTGLSSRYWDIVVGSRAIRDFYKDDFICIK